GGPPVFDIRQPLYRVFFLRYFHPGVLVRADHAQVFWTRAKDLSRRRSVHRWQTGRSPRSVLAPYFADDRYFAAECRSVEPLLTLESARNTTAGLRPYRACKRSD